MEEAWFSVVVGHLGCNRSTWGSLNRSDKFSGSDLQWRFAEFITSGTDAMEKIFQEIEVALDSGYS